MSIEKTIEVLKYNRDMCFFDPTTGENDHPINKDCAELAEALNDAIAALQAQTGSPVSIYEILDDGTANEIIYGYLIIAAENAGMDQEQIRQLRNGLRLALSEKTAKEAERYYNSRT